MKNLITGVACMLLLSIFLIQFTTNQVVHNKILFAENDINSFIEEIKADGYISNEAKLNLENKLKTDLKDNGANITITGYMDSQNPKKRGDTISYSVTYEIKGVIGAAGMLNMDDSNKALRTRSGIAASEYVSW